MERTAGRRVYRHRRGQRARLGGREKRRLGQLLVCLALFAVILLAKGSGSLPRLREELTAVLRSSADFPTALADLGRSISAGRPVSDTLDLLWSDVFLAKTRTAPLSRADGPLYLTVRQELDTDSPPDLLATAPVVAAPAPAEVIRFDPAPLPEGTADAGDEPPAEPIPESEPSAEPAVVYVEYTGPALPDNATMDRYALGLEGTVSPVLAPLSSAYGWRIHPIDGDEKFHQGVDLAADTGTPVLAFAAGRVDYIGESGTYGQYLQIDHGNGVTTFYAHCSKLLVQKGQQVAAGETVALSGATGRVTGAHLHFELKKDGVRLNPLYYIDIQP